MFVLLLTPPRRRPAGDLVTPLAEALAHLPVRGPERTIGQDAIVLADRADHAVQAMLTIQEVGTWRVGLGIGALYDPTAITPSDTTPSDTEPSSTTPSAPMPRPLANLRAVQEIRAVEGPALNAALEALRAATVTAQVPLAVRAADARQEENAADAEAVLRLIGWMIRSRSPGQWKVVRALREQPRATQQQLAQHLGVTQQTVSRSLQTSGWREESAAHPLLVRLLSMIDLTSGH